MTDEEIPHQQTSASDKLTAELQRLKQLADAGNPGATAVLKIFWLNHGHRFR